MTLFDFYIFRNILWSTYVSYTFFIFHIHTTPHRNCCDNCGLLFNQLKMIPMSCLTSFWWETFFQYLMDQERILSSRVTQLTIWETPSVYLMDTPEEKTKMEKKEVWKSYTRKHQCRYYISDNICRTCNSSYPDCWPEYLNRSCLVTPSESIQTCRPTEIHGSLSRFWQASTHR